MIFIGPELNDQHAHFVTNIVDSIGSGNDLIIDLLEYTDKKEIFQLIAEHLKKHHDRYVIYNAYEDEEFFLLFRRYFPDLRLIIIFSDDEWRHMNYDRYLSLFADVFTITVWDHMVLYQAYHLEPYYMQWACNPNKFHPLPNRRKKYDVSFIGAAYGKRVEYIQYLLKEGVDVKVFGRGWDRLFKRSERWGGYLTHEEMLEVISQSRINLNFLWTSANPDRDTIKGRTMELAACKAFQLSSYTHEFANSGFRVDENIAVFRDKSDLLKKIRYYLKHDAECEAIATRAFEHVLKHHTWGQRFQRLFDKIEMHDYSSQIERKFRVLVIVGQEISHYIDPCDDRMDIQISRDGSKIGIYSEIFDGVIHLKRDSNINNDAIYMMVFGLIADKSDVIAANFYVGTRKSGHWIRFRDRVMETKRTLLQMLPCECLMYSYGYAKQNGCVPQKDKKKMRVSYVEYPVFSISLSYTRGRLLRLYFANHRNPRQRFRAYVKNWRFDLALSLAIDKFWQKLLIASPEE